jgi:putative oxidoreductase
MRWLFETDESYVTLVQRLALAATIVPHGLQKTVGWFGGYGFDGTMQFFTGTMGLSAPLAALVIAIESVGMLALAFGAGSRLAALGLAAVMTGAIATMHWEHGFFMNWFGSQGGEGFEYHLLVLALALPIVVRGGGAWSVDAFLAGHGAHVVPAIRRSLRAHAA